MSEIPIWHIHFGFYGYLNIKVNENLFVWFPAFITAVVKYIFDE